MPVFLELFMFPGLLFWLLIVGELLFLSLMLADQYNRRKSRSGGMVFSVILVVLALQFFGNIPIFQTLQANPGYSALGLLGWFLLSIPHAYLKWTLLCNENDTRYNALFDEYRKLPGNWEKLPQNVNDFSLEQKVAWKEYFDQHSHTGYGEPPIEFHMKVSEHASDLLTWMTFWPIDLAVLLLTNPITHAYHWIAGSLQRIADARWKLRANHMPSDEEYKKVVEARREKQRQEAAQRQAAHANGQTHPSDVTV